MQSSDKVKNYYDKVADEYNDTFYIKENEYPPLKFRHNYILEMIKDENLPSNSRILDVGCGPGELVIELAKNYDEIYGMDFSKEMIRIAKDKLKESKHYKNSVIFDVGDIEDLNFENEYFDVVICSGVVEYLKNDDLWVKQVTRVLKPEGILIVNVTNAFAIRRWSMPLINIFKSVPGIFASMNFIKTKILKMDKLNSFPFKPRVHSPKQFDKFINSHSLRKISHNYFDFSIFPYPIDTVLNFILLKPRKKMEKYTRTNAVLWGNGYIVKCKKNRVIRDQ